MNIDMIVFDIYRFVLYKSHVQVHIKEANITFSHLSSFLSLNVI